MSENIEMTENNVIKPKSGKAKSTSSADATKAATVKINTVDLLIIHLSKYIAAYRKSYKLCDRVDTALKITSGLIGCAAVLALVPAIPILVAVFPVQFLQV